MTNRSHQSQRLLKTRTLAALLLSLGCALSSCSGDPPPVLPPDILVAISPSTVALVPGATKQFIAVVSGSDNTAVTFSVTESNGGSITAAGLYTAPAAPGSFHVVAASVADPTRKSTAVVVVVPPGVTVALSPTSASVVTGASQQFTATVTGSANTAAAWSVTEASGGTISAGGLYTAPTAAGTFHVVATSAADTSTTATAVVTVTATAVVAITLSPPTAALQFGATQQFTATVTGSANTSVTYSVTEASGGTVTAAGLYTAPDAAGTFHVVATSAADTSKTSTATVTVTMTVSPATALAWTDPVNGTYQLKKNAGLSTATHLVLDLTGVNAPTGTGIAFTLSADTAAVTWAKVAAADPELIQNGAVLALGTGVQALRGKATGALLQGVTAKKGLGSAVPLSGVLARVAVDLKPGVAKGAVALSATKAQVLLADGSLSLVTIAAGTLAAQ